MILRWIDMDTALARLNAWGADDRSPTLPTPI